MEYISFCEADFQTIANPSLKRKILKLLNLIEDLVSKSSQLRKENEQLKAELARLRQQPARPIFSPQEDSLSRLEKIEAPKPVWKKAVKKDVLEIDQIIPLTGIETCNCGKSEFTTLRTEKKIVQGISFKRNNICYIRTDKQCNHCGTVYKGHIPDDVKGLEFDPQLRTFISYMKFHCRITQPLLHTMLNDIGINISTGQISRILLENSQKLTRSYTHLRTRGINNAPYLQTDATGHKFKQKTYGKIVDQHIHFLGHSRLSLFRITPRYNTRVIEKLLTKRGRDKPLVSDDGGANGARLLMQHKQLCWLHEIRHYRKLHPAIELHQDKLNEVVTGWYDFYRAALTYSNHPNDSLKKILQAVFNRIVNQKTGYNELDYRLSLTKGKKKRLLLFLYHPTIPINNNQAERDLRPAVIMRKISHGTKSVMGNKSIERHLSVIHTADKQGLNIWHTLHGLLSGTLSPYVLTTRSL